MKSYLVAVLVIVLSLGAFFAARSNSLWAPLAREDIYVLATPKEATMVYVGWIATYDGDTWESHYTRTREAEVREWPNAGRAAAHLRHRYMGME